MFWAISNSLKHKNNKTPDKLESYNFEEVVLFVTDMGAEMINVDKLASNAARLKQRIEKEDLFAKYEQLYARESGRTLSGSHLAVVATVGLEEEKEDDISEKGRDNNNNNFKKDDDNNIININTKGKEREEVERRGDGGGRQRDGHHTKEEICLDKKKARKSVS